VSDPEISRLLGRIDGKLDQVIDSFKEHREDDKRRFTEVHARLDDHAEDINKAKGAKGAIVWLVGLISGGISALVMAWVKAKGGG
jgi:hypothetical protein